jgi:outer membrane protein OmpA-like peptidoglycan-associated protein
MGQGNYRCREGSHFKRGNIPFFSDEFEKSDRIDPQKWEPVSSVNNCVTVETFGSKAAMTIRCETVGIVQMSASLNGMTHYLRDTFTLEYAFKFLPEAAKAPSGKALYWEIGNRVRDSSVAFSLDEFGIYGCRDMCYKAANTSRSFESKAGAFDISEWHLIKMEFFRGSYSLWLDERCVISNTGCGFVPYSVRLGGIGPIAIGNVILAARKNVDMFDAILRGNKLVSRNINFATNSATIDPGSKPYLELLTSFLKKNSRLKLAINGHTDSVGDNERNLLLSTARAEAVKKFLVDAGIKADRLESKGFGASQPVSTNNTEEGRWQNRRVEFSKIAQ